MIFLPSGCVIYATAASTILEAHDIRNLKEFQEAFKMHRNQIRQHREILYLVPPYRWPNSTQERFELLEALNELIFNSNGLLIAIQDQT